MENLIELMEWIDMEINLYKPKHPHMPSDRYDAFVDMKEQILSLSSSTEERGEDRRKIISDFLHWYEKEIHPQDVYSQISKYFESNPPLAEKKDGIDLKKIEKNIDEALDKETPESMTAWLNEKRNLEKLNSGEGEVVMECESCGKKFTPIDSFQCDTCRTPKPITIHIVSAEQTRIEELENENSRLKMTIKRLQPRRLVDED